jgi:origin recognition complex subunit 1
MDGCTFSCLSALDSVQGTFYSFDWADHRTQALKGVAINPRAWCLKPSESLMGDTPRESGSGDSDSEDLDHLISSTRQVRTTQRTPSKRARSNSPITPRRRAAPTPHSKAALRTRLETKRRRVSQHVGSQPTFTDAMDLEHLPKDARLRAMHALHVGSRPEALPCREDEYSNILSKVLELIEEGAGGCVCEFAFPEYISSLYLNAWLETYLVSLGQERPRRCMRSFGS